jgi:hypothetical protein
MCTTPFLGRRWGGHSAGSDFVHAGNGTPGSGTNNGDVWGITNNKDTTRSQTFDYDPLNRLTAAQNAGTAWRTASPGAGYTDIA